MEEKRGNPRSCQLEEGATHTGEAERHIERELPSEGKLAVRGGTPRPSIAREKPLFDGEFAPPEEKLKAPARFKPEQKTLFEVKKLRRADFRAQGLRRFDNVNTWLMKVQPFMEKGYIIEYGHEGGRNGWARVLKIKKPGKGRLISKATVPTFTKTEPVQGELLGEPVEDDPPAGDHLTAKTLDGRGGIFERDNTRRRFRC
jgi:hypothetical protein